MSTPEQDAAFRAAWNKGFSSGDPAASSLSAPEGRAPSIAEQLEELRCGIAGALGLSPVPDDAALVKAAKAAHEAAEAWKGRAAALAGEYVEPLQNVVDGLRKELATRPTEGEIAAFKASLEEARAAEDRERRRAEAAETAFRERDVERTKERERAEKAEGERDAWARRAGEAERHVEAARRRVQALEAELKAERADNRLTEAQALIQPLRRRLAAVEEELRGEQSAHRRQAGITMMVLDMLFDKTMACGQFAERLRELRSPVAPAPPEELQCHGSGAPPGPLDGRGRYRCPECDFSVGITPKALDLLPTHPPVHATEAP